MTELVFSEFTRSREAFGIVYRGVWSHSELHGCDERGGGNEDNGGWSYSEKDRVEFLKEVAIMGQFHHPNIINNNIGKCCTMYCQF